MVSMAESKRALIGVAHADRAELKKLRAELDKRKPASVGLELRENYAELREAGLRVGFFGDLYDHFQTKRIRVVLLDDVRLVNETNAAQLIKAVHEGVLSIDQIKCELSEITTSLSVLDPKYVAPEQVIALESQKKLLERGFDINKEFPTAEALLSYWDKLALQRSEHFIARMIETLPDTAIVGLAHAVQIEQKLKELYVLEKFSGNVNDPPLTRIGSDLFGTE